ncbi:MAG: hypothetical protein AVDCRST_MAG78-3518 [uncultured Rubrobacteraceae bacterium]|uniref:Uncharacterized protein n=1 Tax=uncultured Rubrobacteraceae bacterium TaxID=349277 RepID=A0A6J4QU03_9ACTN|nr:MAG: hypothetical protein AVDCRST_MAG78-3518 [uncultured Rubrobacteraceae bacterium]
MTSNVRNRLLLLGALWGLVLAALPAVLAFDDRFVLSPFLVAAFVCAGLSGAVGALVAGRGAAATSSTRRGLLAVSGVGALQGLVSGTLAALSIWLALAVTISGFSAGSPGEILDLLRRPEIFVESAIAAIAILVYTLTVGTLLSPVVGAVLCRLVRRGPDAHRATPEAR